MKLLITGFAPFGNLSINSSWEVANAIAHDEFPGVDIIAEKLLVSFNKVPENLKLLVAKYQPDGLLMLGQAAKSDEIRLERVAINLKDASSPDNDGECPNEEVIIEDGETAYLSSFPLKLLQNRLLKKHIPARISNTAGTFVCNTVYYYALYLNHIIPKKMSVLFVHLPLLENQIESDENHKGLSLDVMKTAITEIVNAMVEDFEK